jgi:acetyl-CoA synthetase
MSAVAENRRRAEERWRRFVDEVRRGDHTDFAGHWHAFREAYADSTLADGPPFAWWPGERERERSNLAALARRLDLAGPPTYEALHRFSVENREAFWRHVIDELGIRFARPPERILDLSAGVESPRWLHGAEWNVVDSCFQAPPERIAVVSAGEGSDALRRITYGELASLVDRFANGFREHGFAAGDAVALYMPMTVECVAAYLGIVRAGGRVVSVADSFSATELARRMEIAGAPVVTVDAYLRAGRRIELYDKARTAVENLAATGSAAEARCIVIPGGGGAEVQPAPGDLAWSGFLGLDGAFASVLGPSERITNVLFSSGTTGTPKAIPWTQITPLKAAMDGRYHQDVQPDDVVAWPTNVGWMMGPWLIYATLLNRATMALYEGAPHSRGFVDFVERAGVTVLGLVPAVVRAWRTQDLVSRDAFTGVRIFSSTGEASSAEDYLWLMSRSAYRAPVIEYLGGTEIGGGYITGSVLDPASPATFSGPNLGLDFVVLDESGEPAEAGEMGELFLIPPSIGLSQTLLNRDHHEEYYAGCPPGPGGEVLRRHGDQFLRLGRGYFKAQGRADDTMNLGGIKVGSQELEEVLDAHPAVLESAAVGVQMAGEGADRLVAYVVLDEGREDTDPDTLRRELRRRLADELNPLFKIDDLVVLDELPRTASNKVMRRELRARYRQGAKQAD